MGGEASGGRCGRAPDPSVALVRAAIALDDGPDATQEALTVVFRRLPTLREPAALHGWVRAIATREAVRIARRAPRSPPSSRRTSPPRAIRS